MARNLVLFGDSVFDNGAYVGPDEKNVTQHLRDRLKATDWSVELRAVDGAVAGDIESQMTGSALPVPSTLVLGVGGNDALGQAELLKDQAADKTLAQSLMVFRQVKESFRHGYSRALAALGGVNQRVIVCTIYNPHYSDAAFNALATTALSFFNDVIVEEAMARGLEILDLRWVCAEPAAFANPIEPSDYGGRLIAEAITDRLGQDRRARPRNA